MTSDSGSVHNIHYGDILVKYDEVVSLLHHNVDCLTVEGETNSPKDYICDGDVIIADTAEDETVGKTVEIQDVGNSKVVAGLHTFLYRPPSNMFVRGWLGYWMNSSAYHSQLFQYMTGTKVLSLTRTSIAATVIQYPSKELQQQIVTALDSIQTQINATQKLIAKYEAIKKATVNLLLKPKAGWDKIRLGDFESHRNNTCSRSLTSRTGYIHNIHYGDILVKFGEIVSLKQDQVAYLSEEGEANSPNDYLQDGDIVIADTAEDETAGKVVEVQDVSNRKAVAGLHTVFLRPPTDLFARGWLGYWMNSRFYHDQLLPYLTGIKVLSLAKSSLTNTEIYYPSRTEQEQLVRTLESIDTHLVALHTQAEKARYLKAGMMSYFFG